MRAITVPPRPTPRHGALAQAIPHLPWPTPGILIGTYPTVYTTRWMVYNESHHLVVKCLDQRGHPFRHSRAHEFSPRSVQVPGLSAHAIAAVRRKTPVTQPDSNREPLRWPHPRCLLRASTIALPMLFVAYLPGTPRPRVSSGCRETQQARWMRANDRAWHGPAMQSPMRLDQTLNPGGNRNAVTASRRH